MAFDLASARPVEEGQPAAPARFDPASALPAAKPAISEAQRSAPTSGLVMGFRDPIDAGAQLLPRALGAITSLFGLAPNRVSNFLDSEAARVDNIVRDTNAGYEQSRVADALPSTEKPGFDLARLVGNVANPATWLGGAPTKGAGLLQLAGAGAKAGAVSGAMQPVLDTDNFWTEKAKQTAMGAGTGAIATPAIVKGTTAAVDLAGKARAALANRTPQAVDPQQVAIQINNLLASQKVNPRDVPAEVRGIIKREIEAAMQGGRRIDPASILRKAEFEAVGLAGDTGPTVGQLTRDTNPMNFANEKNMSGIVLDRGQRGMGNDLADRFQNQNKGLQALFDNAGASGAMDKGTAGKQIIDALKAVHQPNLDKAGALFDAASGMEAGRRELLDAAHFSQQVNKVLDADLLGDAVPEKIAKLINDYSSGAKPLDVQNAVLFQRKLARLQREPSIQGTESSVAISKIMDALQETPFAKQAAVDAARTVDDPIIDAGVKVNLKPGGPVDEGQAARDAFNAARAAWREAKATENTTPALKAAMKDVSPDKFVSRYVIGADARDLAAMKKVLDASPEAKDQARAQIAEHLKRAAFGENPSGDKAFAPDRYLKAIRAIGKQNLEVFFTPDEVVKLNLAGKVASDINAEPAGAKYGTARSGTPGALMSILTKMGAKVTDFMPVIGPAGKAVVGAVGDKLGAVKTQAAIDKAINPVAERVNTGAISPAAQRLIQAPAPAIGVAAGAAASAGATSPPDMDRARAIRADFRAGRIDKAEAIKRLNALGIE